MNNIPESGMNKAMMNPPPDQLQDVWRIYPHVVVHGLEHALKTLQLGLPVTLLSAPGAVCTGGVGWWRALVAQAVERHPHTPCHAILDCADAAGFAMAALRAGQLYLILSPVSPAHTAVAAAAGSLGGQVWSNRPPALDLAARGAVLQLADYLTTQPPLIRRGRDSAPTLR